MPELFIIIFILFLSATYAYFRGAPWLPIWKRDIERIFELIEIKKGDIFYDLGCGDGRILSAVAKKGASAFGIEISFFPYFLAFIRKILAKNKFNLILNDYWFVDLRDADIVFIFLTPKFHDKIDAKLKKELKKGARVVSYVWPVKGLNPKKISKEEKRPDLYLYEI